MYKTANHTRIFSNAFMMSLRRRFISKGIIHIHCISVKSESPEFKLETQQVT